MQQAVTLIQQQLKSDNSLHPSQYAETTSQPTSIYPHNGHRISPESDLKEVKIHSKTFSSFPEVICEAIHTAPEDSHIISGYLSDIDRVYVVVNDTIYFWNFNLNYKTTILTHSSQFSTKNDKITHVLVAPAFPGCFEPAVTHILLLIYSTHVQILSIQPNPTSPIDTAQTGLLSQAPPTQITSINAAANSNGIAKYNSFYLGQTNLVCLLDPEHTITSIASTSSGRIFCGLSDSHITEIVYAKSLLPESRPFFEYVFGKKTTNFTNNLLNTVFGEIAANLSGKTGNNNTNTNNNTNNGNSLGYIDNGSDKKYDQNDDFSTQTRSRQRPNTTIQTTEIISKLESTIQFRRLTSSSLTSLLLPIWDKSSPILEISIDESRADILLFALYQDQTINCYSLGPTLLSLRPKGQEVSTLVQYYTNVAFSETKHKNDITLIATITPKQLQTQLKIYLSQFQALTSHSSQAESIRTNQIKKNAFFDLLSLQTISAQISRRYQCLVTTTEGHRIYLSLFSQDSSQVTIVVGDVKFAIVTPPKNNPHGPVLSPSRSYLNSNFNSLINSPYSNIHAVCEETNLEIVKNDLANSMIGLNNLTQNPSPSVPFTDLSLPNNPIYLSGDDLDHQSDEMKEKNKQFGTLIHIFTNKTFSTPHSFENDSILSGFDTSSAQNNNNKNKITQNAESVEYIFVPARVSDISPIPLFSPYSSYLSQSSTQPSSPLSAINSSSQLTKFFLSTFNNFNIWPGTQSAQFQQQNSINNQSAQFNTQIVQYNQQNTISAFNSTTTPSTLINITENFLQHLLPPPAFTVLTSTGVIVLQISRPIHSFFLALKSSHNDHSTKPLVEFITKWGHGHFMGLLLLFLTGLVPLYDQFISKDEICFGKEFLLQIFMSDLTIGTHVGIVRNVNFVEAHMKYVHAKKQQLLLQQQQQQQQQQQLQQQQQKQQQQQQQQQQFTQYQRNLAQQAQAQTAAIDITYNNPYPAALAVSLKSSHPRLKSIATLVSRLVSPIWSLPMVFFTHKKQLTSVSNTVLLNSKNPSNLTLSTMPSTVQEIAVPLNLITDALRYYTPSSSLVVQGDNSKNAQKPKDVLFQANLSTWLPTNLAFSLVSSVFSDFIGTNHSQSPHNLPVQAQTQPKKLSKEEQLLNGQLVPRSTLLQTQIKSIREPLLNLFTFLNQNFEKILETTEQNSAQIQNIPILGAVHISNPADSVAVTAGGNVSDDYAHEGAISAEAFRPYILNQQKSGSTPTQTPSGDYDSSIRIAPTHSQSSVADLHDFSSLKTLQYQQNKELLSSLLVFLHSTISTLGLFHTLLRLVAHISPSATLGDANNSGNNAKRTRNGNLSGQNSQNSQNSQNAQNAQNLTSNAIENLPASFYDTIYNIGYEMVFSLFPNHLLYSLSVTSFGDLIVSKNGQSLLRALASNLALGNIAYSTNASTRLRLSYQDCFGSNFNVNSNNNYHQYWTNVYQIKLKMEKSLAKIGDKKIDTKIDTKLNKNNTNETFSLLSALSPSTDDNPSNTISIFTIDDISECVINTLSPKIAFFERDLELTLFLASQCSSFLPSDYLLLNTYDFLVTSHRKRSSAPIQNCQNSFDIINRNGEGSLFALYQTFLSSYSVPTKPTQSQITQVEQHTLSNIHNNTPQISTMYNRPSMISRGGLSNLSTSSNGVNKTKITPRNTSAIDSQILLLSSSPTISTLVQHYQLTMSQKAVNNIKNNTLSSSTAIGEAIQSTLPGLTKNHLSLITKQRESLLKSIQETLHHHMMMIPSTRIESLQIMLTLLVFDPQINFSSLIPVLLQCGFIFIAIELVLLRLTIIYRHAFIPYLTQIQITNNESLRQNNQPQSGHQPSSMEAKSSAFLPTINAATQAAAANNVNAILITETDMISGMIKFLQDNMTPQSQNVQFSSRWSSIHLADALLTFQTLVLIGLQSIPKDAPIISSMNDGGYGTIDSGASPPAGNKFTTPPAASPGFSFSANSASPTSLDQTTNSLLSLLSSQSASLGHSSSLLDLLAYRINANDVMNNTKTKFNAPPDTFNHIIKTIYSLQALVPLNNTVLPREVLNGSNVNDIGDDGNKAIKKSTTIPLLPSVPYNNQSLDMITNNLVITTSLYYVLNQSVKLGSQANFFKLKEHAKNTHLTDLLTHIDNDALLLDYAMWHTIETVVEEPMEALVGQSQQNTFQNNPQNNPQNNSKFAPIISYKFTGNTVLTKLAIDILLRLAILPPNTHPALDTSDNQVVYEHSQPNLVRLFPHDVSSGHINAHTNNRSTFDSLPINIISTALTTRQLITVDLSKYAFISPNHRIDINTRQLCLALALQLANSGDNAGCGENAQSSYNISTQLNKSGFPLGLVFGIEQAIVQYDLQMYIVDILKKKIKQNDAIISHHNMYEISQKETFQESINQHVKYRLDQEQDDLGCLLEQLNSCIISSEVLIALLWKFKLYSLCLVVLQSTLKFSQKLTQFRFEINFENYFGRDYLEEVCVNGVYCDERGERGERGEKTKKIQKSQQNSLSHFIISTNLHSFITTDQSQNYSTSQPVTTCSLTQIQELITIFWTQTIPDFFLTSITLQHYQNFINLTNPTQHVTQQLSFDSNSNPVNSQNNPSLPSRGLQPQPLKIQATPQILSWETHFLTMMSKLLSQLDFDQVLCPLSLLVTLLEDFRYFYGSINSTPGNWVATQLLPPANSAHHLRVLSTLLTVYQTNYLAKISQKGVILGDNTTINDKRGRNGMDMTFSMKDINVTMNGTKSMIFGGNSNGNGVGYQSINLEPNDYLIIASFSVLLGDAIQFVQPLIDEQQIGFNNSFTHYGGKRDVRNNQLIDTTTSLSTTQRHKLLALCFNCLQFISNEQLNNKKIQIEFMLQNVLEELAKGGKKSSKNLKISQLQRFHLDIIDDLIHRRALFEKLIADAPLANAV